MKACPRLEIRAEIGVIDSNVQKLYRIANGLSAVGLDKPSDEIAKCLSEIQESMGEILLLAKKIQD